MLRNSVKLLGMSLVLGACSGAPTSPTGELSAETASLRAQGAGLVRTTWPSAQDPGMPFYARINPDAPQLFIVDGWAVIAFYREPDCIPEGFNLLEFFDPPAAFACPLRVRGSTLWHGEAFAGAPKIVQIEALGTVPFWFVPAGPFLAAAQDGQLTIGEISAIPGRITGQASRYNETVHPHPNPPSLGGGGGHPRPKLIITAQGTLDGGGTFQYHVTLNQGKGTIRLQLR